MTPKYSPSIGGAHPLTIGAFLLSVKISLPLERVFTSGVDVEEVFELLSILALELMLILVLPLVALLKSMVLVGADSEVAILLFDILIADPLLLSAESSPKVKEAIHFPVIIAHH